MLQPTLASLGLGGHESAVFAALLEQSPASATTIAKTCHLSRSSVYTTLSSLIAKGLVGTTYKNEVKQFIAQGYGSMEQWLKREEEDVKSRMKLLATLKEELKKSQNQDQHTPKIIIFEGQEGLKRIYMSMMRAAPIGATMSIVRDEFVWKPEWKFIFDEEWHERVKRIKTEKNIATDLLINDSKEERSHEKLYKSRKSTRLNFLPKGTSVNQFAMYIMHDMVSLMSMEENNVVGVEITNDSLAKNMKELFDGLTKKISK